MNVLIIPPGTKTGERRYSDYLINGLKDMDINVDLLDNSIFSNPRLKIFLGSFLLNNFTKNDTNIIHNIDNLGPYLLKRKNQKAKYVLTIHDIAPIILPAIHSPIIKYDFKNFLPRIAKNCDSIITVSYSTKRDILANFNINEDKLSVVHLGVDSFFFKPQDINYTVLNKYGITKKYILYVGSENPRKNLQNLILAFTYILKELPYDLVLVGPISKNYIKTMFNSRGIFGLAYKDLSDRIILPGYINNKDLPLIYSAASVFIFPSLYEGFGLPVVEAMACGTPVIVSDNSSLREVAGEAGIYLSDPLNPKEIAENILTVLKDESLLEKLKIRVLEQAKKFTWENTVEKTIQVYDKLS